jgi:hypothetical protein
MRKTFAARAAGDSVRMLGVTVALTTIAATTAVRCGRQIRAAGRRSARLGGARSSAPNAVRVLPRLLSVSGSQEPNYMTASLRAFSGRGLSA